MNADVRGSSATLWFLLAALGCAERSRICRVPTPYVQEYPRGPVVPLHYRVACPDVLQVRFPLEPDRDCLAVVDLDGRLNLGHAQRPLVEGKTTAEVEEAIQAALELRPEQVLVQLAEPRAGRIFLRGPESNRQRVYVYRGPERVLDFLARTAALAPGRADLTDVYVLRPNVALGGRPEVYHLDYAALLQGDEQSNIVLRPQDTVIVGEMRRSSFSRLLPRWLLPLYRRIMSIVPDGWPWITARSIP